MICSWFSARISISCYPVQTSLCYFGFGKDGLWTAILNIWSHRKMNMKRFILVCSPVFIYLFPLCWCGLAYSLETTVTWRTTKAVNSITTKQVSTLNKASGIQLIFIQVLFPAISFFKVPLQTFVSAWGTLEEYKLRMRSGTKYSSFSRCWTGKPVAWPLLWEERFCSVICVVKKGICWEI